MTPRGRLPNSALTRARRQLRQLQPPRRCAGQRVHVLHRVEVDDEAGVGGLVHAHELGLALDQVSARRGSRRWPGSARGRPRRARSGCRASPATTGTTTWPAGRFLNAEISSVRSPAPIIGWSARATNTASKLPLRAAEPDAHRALLPLGVRRVVRERHRESQHLGLDRLARVAGDDDHLVDPGAAERDQMPADRAARPAGGSAAC